MNATEKKNVIAMPTAGIYSEGIGYGVLVKTFEYGIEDYAIFTVVCGGRETAHRRKINYSSAGERLFFNIDGRRVYLDEVLRV